MPKNRKFNPADLLHAYRQHPDFAVICREAGRLATTGADSSMIRQCIAERYGSPTEPPRQTLRDRAQPLALVGPEFIDPAAIQQIRTALRLPPAIRGALIPDAHYGYALPVGGVVAYDRVVVPYQVGVDIG